MTTSQERGLYELAEGIWAYLPGSATWCFSNTGLIASDSGSMLVDTMIDLRSTRQMLDDMAHITGTRPIRSAVNTHADPDHCFGNELVPATAEILATETTAIGMAERSPQRMRDLIPTLPTGGAREFVTSMLEGFAVDEVSGRLPDRTFTSRESVLLGDRRVDLIDLGPAHSSSDVIAHVPDAGVVFTGDLVFAGSTPISWAGGLSRWLDAVDAICELDASVIVPGHGPVTDKNGAQDVCRYFRFIQEEATKRHDSGMSSLDVALDIELAEFADWSDPERIVVTVDVIFAELDPSRPPTAIADLYAQMGRYRRERASK